MSYVIQCLSNVVGLSKELVTHVRGSTKTTTRKKRGPAISDFFSLLHACMDETSLEPDHAICLTFKSDSSTKHTRRVQSKDSDTRRVQSKDFDTRRVQSKDFDIKIEAHRNNASPFLMFVHLVPCTSTKHQVHLYCCCTSSRHVLEDLRRRKPHSQHGTHHLYVLSPGSLNSDEKVM
jgi:hypothetical protein